MAGAEFLRISSTGIVRLQHVQKVRPRPDHHSSRREPLNTYGSKPSRNQRPNAPASKADPRFITAPDSALNRSFDLSVFEPTIIV
jgi:hypothetical protein